MARPQIRDEEYEDIFEPTTAEVLAPFNLDRSHQGCTFIPVMDSPPGGDLFGSGEYIVAMQQVDRTKLPDAVTKSDCIETKNGGSAHRIDNDTTAITAEGNMPQAFFYKPATAKSIGLRVFFK